jgi:hypothetical protein
VAVVLEVPVITLYQHQEHQEPVLVLVQGYVVQVEVAEEVLDRG